MRRPIRQPRRRRSLPIRSYTLPAESTIIAVVLLAGTNYELQMSLPVFGTAALATVIMADATGSINGVQPSQTSPTTFEVDTGLIPAFTWFSDRADFRTPGNGLLSQNPV